MEFNEDWKDVEYKKIKEKSFIHKIKLFISKDDCFQICINSFTLKLFSITFKFWLYIVNLMILYVSIFAPFQTIYIAFSSDSSDFQFNNRTYYDTFTEINGGIEYDLDKTKLKLISIFSATIFILSSTIFLVSPILTKINSIIFLLLYLFINTCNFSLNIYILIINSRLGSSFKEYINVINKKFAEKDKDIIPFEHLYSIKYNVSYIIIHLVFLYIYYVFIFNIFYAKRNYEKRQYISSKKNEKEEKLTV